MDDEARHYRMVLTTSSLGILAADALVGGVTYLRHWLFTQDTAVGVTIVGVVSFVLIGILMGNAFAYHGVIVRNARARQSSNLNTTGYPMRRNWSSVLRAGLLGSLADLTGLVRWFIVFCIVVNTAVIAGTFLHRLGFSIVISR